MSKKRGFLYRLGYSLERGRIAFLEGFYAAHVKLRYLHDRTYQKGPRWYKSWSDKPYSDKVHKTAFVGFFVSFLVFSLLQNMLPYLFNPGRPQVALAGSNTKSWTFRSDFTPATSTNIQITGTNPGDDADISLNPNTGVVVPDYGTGADGTVSIWGGVTIADLYEKDTLGGVTTIRGENKGLNKGIGTYNPSTGAVPNFTYVSINEYGTLTTTGPSGANPGVAIEFKASQGLYIDSLAGGIIADGDGYAGGVGRQKGYGTGGGNYSSSAACGAGYGGVGGNMSGCTGGITYTSFPDFGSGGGSFTYAGGAGGGKIKIQAKDFSISQTIRANGNGPVNGGTGTYDGGGSGGSIYIITDSSVSANMLEAHGGPSGNWNGTAGGGGRVTVQASNVSGNPNVLAGTGRGTGMGNGVFTSYVDLFQHPGYIGETGTPLSFDSQGRVKSSTITWNGSALSSGQSVKFMIRTSDDNSNWSGWYGPSGAAGDWSNNYFGQVYGGTAYSAIPDSVAASRYIQVKVKIDSNGKDTPTINQINLGYNNLDAPSNLKTFKIDGSTEIVADSYTNETQLKLKADLGVPFSPSSSNSPITTELEVRNSDTGWTDTAGVYPTGVTATTGSISYSCSANPCTALGLKDVGTLYGLTSGTYYYRVRIKDGAGRASAWSASSTLFNVELDPPVIQSISINSGATFTTSANANVTITNLTDSGGSGLSSLYLSNNAIDWVDVTDRISDYQTSFIGQSSYSGNVNWNLAPGGDGLKRVYARAVDRAGNNSDTFKVNEPFEGSAAKDQGATTADWSAGQLQLPAAYWTLKTPIASPSARYGSLMAYDSFRNKTVLYSGNSGLGQTWEYDGSTWTQKTPAASPTATADASLTYDSSRHRVVLFGGYGGGEKAETWEYDGTNWVKINPVHSPSSRQDGAITFDSARNRVVFFGGYHTGTGGMNDTWEYDGVDWSQIVTANAPSTRYYTGMTFDSVRNKVVLFGGLGAGTTRYNDTWEYNGTNWTQLSTATSPAARETWQNMVFDNLKGRVVLFGGRDANSAMLNDTWEFNGIDWIQRNYVGKPSARFTFGITYDTTSSKTILFGGLNGGALGETWEGKDVFDTPKTAQSLKLNVTTGVITGATITKTDNPNGQSVSYYLTADGGSHWEGPVNAGNEWIFANPGNDLRWKIDLSTNNPAATPVVSDLTIDYRIDPATDSITLDTAAPTAFSLTTPADNTWFGSASPTLNWNASTDPSGIAYYQLYVDGTLNRDNIAGLSTTPTSPLAEGMHTWYIRAVDAAGNGTNSTQTNHVGYDASTPAAPATFTATGGTDTITLNWNFSNNTGSPIEKVIVERIDWTAYDPAHPTDPWNSYLSYKYKEYDGGTTSAVYSVSDVDPDTKIAQGRRYAYRIAGKDSINSAYGTYSTVRSGLTEDSIFDVILGNVSVAPCDGVSNCSTKPSIGHKGFETKIAWDPAVDTGVGTTHYLVYRSETDLNSGNYGDATVRNSYQIVGVLPYTGGAQQPVWYDNDANNDATTTFYDATGGTITISPEIQALTAKTVASPRLDDYHLYYYRVVGVDANNNKSPVFAESITSDAFEVLKAHRNGNSGLDAERTPDVTAPNVPTGLSVVASGIDTKNSQPDPTQGMTVSWNPSTDNSSRTVSYRLFRNLGTISGPGGQWDEITLPNGGTGTAYQDEGLEQNTYYYYKVSAKDPDNNESSQCSPNAPVKTKNSQVPTTPTYVTIRATKGNPTDSRVGHEISVSFNGSAIRYSTNHITGYEVYRSLTNYGDEASWLALTPIQTISGLNYAGYDGNITYDVTRSFTDNVTDTDGAKTYYYKVRAIGTNSDGPVVSSLSAIQTGTLYYGWDTTPDIKAPALPADVKVKDIHDDGFAFKRNIITWARIPNPDRNGVNDFKEYKIYRSDDGVTWQQICQNGTNNILRNACDAQYPNPLYNANQNIGMATNYYMDLIPIASADQYYYYHVTAIDNAKDGFKYFDNTVINNYSNESAPEIGSNGAIVSVSLNPAIAKPSICNVGSNPCTSTAGATKAVLAEVGVASATITWNTDQPTDSIVEFKRAGTSDAYIGTIDRAKGTSHTVTIKPLVPNTNYDYRVVSRNSLANDATAEGSEVPTLTTTGFNITPGAVVTTTSTTEVNWTTNLDAASAIVEYQLQRQPGDDAQSGVAGASAESLAATPRSHKVIIKGLRSNRTYTYKIKSISKDNFLAEYPQGQFSTFKTKSYDSEQFTLAPSSSNVAERNITSTTAQIVWQTGSPTTSWVDYGTKPGIYDVSSGDNNLTTTHVVVLNGLVPGTKYYYRVRVKDTNEVEFNSQEYTFTAVLKPKITGLTISNVTPYAITISWSTNVETETLMNWGTTTAYGAKRGNAQISTQHSVTIDNLEDNTEYHYQILAHDQAGNEVADDDKVVRTPLDTAGPKISDVKNDILLNEANNTAQVIISWKTDKPATTFVQYDEGVIGGKYTKASVEDTGLSNAHTVIIKDLDPGVAYHYRIITKDKRGNETISNDYNFITPAAEKSILQLILKSLEETFSWVGNVGKYFSSLGKKTK